ncbi:hypothetical protein Asppvi_001753 [Aspergillus pseudoviridinutans]|uniref:Uncharacterized protein n=1 Tax=Aspergillus pseudoviridinutans TaxID=1517512 RepID=A0A9P3B5M9_9EURO|nr:uncharacterized protein Asppvi_001753 [Aspergillus pseudoviridinutans]GIJ83233.1 hypothetical protein Asppvi_001753 [Aspergillus pseudoviridinutans]
MVFGWRTPTYEDQKMKQLFDRFSEFAAINQTGAAAFIDFIPLLRKSPAFLLPTQNKARELHKHEKALYKGHWLKAKEDIRNNNIKPCFCIGMYEAQKRDGFSDDRLSLLHLGYATRGRLRHNLEYSLCILTALSDLVASRSWMV